MKDSILIIDDNKDLLFNLKILFELNDFQVLTADNGVEALKKIYSEKIVPSIILCDIMMPKMDGYEFFKSISLDPNYNSIPFIFLTAKSSTEDVRIGKLLGIDDYLTKPFIEEDLLSIVKGKVNKRKKIQEINNRFHFEDPSTYPGLRVISELTSYENAYLFLIVWDEMEGPKLIDFFSFSKEFLTKNLEKIGVQLFQSSVSIFGFQDNVDRESLLLSIKNINKKGFLLFDSYFDTEVRGNQRLFMFGLINNEITYYDSLIIQKHLEKLAEYYKQNKTLNLNKFFSEIIQNGKLKEI